MLGRRFGLAALGGLSLVFLFGSVDAPLRVEIVDAATGQPLAATVYLADETGKPLVPDGKPSKVEYLGRIRYYVDGSFSLASPPRRLTLEVRRGFETIPEAQTFALDVGTRRLTVRLRRFIDMGRLGYASGDTHVHYLSLADSHLQMRAEDMPVLNLLTSDFTHDAEKFTGHLDPISTQESSVYVGQELRDWQQGHVIFMDLRRLVEPLGPAGGDFMGESHPNRLLVPALREARRQNAVISWAHFENLPGIESAIDISLGLIDSVDLITYNDPTGLPAHWAPWKESGFSQAEFTVMRGVDLYYQYLNAGFRLPVGAGSDKMGDDIPVGCNRFYGRLAGGTGYAGWLAALKAGRGFITNQPLLFLTVDGHEPGDVVGFTGRRKVTARAEAQSLLPFVNLEIVVNGTEVAKHTTYPWQARAEGGIYSARVEAARSTRAAGSPLAWATIPTSARCRSRATSASSPTRAPSTSIGTGAACRSRRRASTSGSTSTAPRTGSRSGRASRPRASGRKRSPRRQKLAASWRRPQSCGAPNNDRAQTACAGRSRHGPAELLDRVSGSWQCRCRHGPDRCG